MENKAYMVPNPMTPCQAIIIDPELCNGCNSCVEVCRTDVLVPNPEKGKPPIVLYPDKRLSDGSNLRLTLGRCYIYVFITCLSFFSFIVSVISPLFLAK